MKIRWDPFLRSYVVKQTMLPTASLPNWVAGQLAFDPTNKTAVADTSIEGVRVQIGQEAMWLVYNNSGATIANGSVCYASGVNTEYDLLTIAKADYNSVATSASTLGLATHDIPDKTIGLVTDFGMVRDFDTTELTAGRPVYLFTNGTMTNTKPTGNKQRILLGTCIKVNETAGIVHVKVNRLGRNLLTKAYSFTSNGIGSGVYYLGGYYYSSAADANLNQGAASQVFGNVNVGYGGHAFIVAGGAGSVDSGVVGIKVTGTSITETGTRTTNDSETLSSDITSLSLNEVLETTKHWIGQITFQLFTVSGSPTTYSLDFNYGLCAHDDFSSRDTTIDSIDVTGLAGGNDTGFDIEFIKHDRTNWTYHATAFVPGDGAIASWSDYYGTKKNLANGHPFSFKANDLDTFIDVSEGEGFLIRITTGANNSVQSMDVQIKAFIEEF